MNMIQSINAEEDVESLERISSQVLQRLGQLRSSENIPKVDDRV